MLLLAFHRPLPQQGATSQPSGAPEFSSALRQLASLLERGVRGVAGELNGTDAIAGPCEFRIIRDFP
jgi:hypothetical protein